MAAIHCRNGPFPPYVQEVSQISVSQLLCLFDTTEVTVIICLWKDYVLSCDRSHETQALSFFAINLFRLRSLRAKFRRYSWGSQVADGWETDGGLCPAQGAPGLSREWCRCAKDRAAPARRTVCCDQTTEKNTTTLKNTSQFGESGNWWREAFRGGPSAYRGQATAEGLKERQQEKEEELTLHRSSLLTLILLFVLKAASGKRWRMNLWLIGTVSQSERNRHLQDKHKRKRERDLVWQCSPQRPPHSPALLWLHCHAGDPAPQHRWETNH